MVATFKSGDLKAAFSATGIAFDWQTATIEAATVDIRAEAREQEKSQSEKTDKLDNDFARHIPVEGEAVGAPGRVGTGAAHSKAHESIQQRKKGKELANFLTRLQQQRMEWERQINWTIQYFEQKAEETATQADELRQKIVDNTERMIENSTFIGGVDKLLKAHKAGEPFDKEQLRKLLKGRGADISDSTSLPILLRMAETMVIKADDENALLEVDNDIHDKAADKLDALVEGFETQAKSLKSKFEVLKAQNLSEEDYKVAVAEILEGVPFEVKREYENKNDITAIDNEVREENIAKEQEEVTVDPMAGFITKEAPQDKPSDNLDNQHTAAPPVPNM